MNSKNDYYDFLRCLLRVIMKGEDFSDGKDIVVNYPSDLFDCFGYPFMKTPKEVEEFLVNETKFEQFDKNFKNIWVYDDFSVSLIICDFNVQVVERIMSKLVRAEEKGLAPNVWEYSCEFGIDVLKTYFRWIAETRGYSENKALIAETSFLGARKKKESKASYWVQADFECHMLLSFLDNIYGVKK